MKNKKLGYGIKIQLLLMAVIPLVVLGVLSILTAESNLKDGLEEEALKQLKATCVAVRASYDNLNDDPYELNKDGELVKGDYNISQNVEKIDTYTDGMDSVVTIFYGDTRKATSLIDSSTGAGIIDTKASDIVADTVLGGKEYSSTNLVINEENYYSYYIPLKNPDDEVVGMVFSGVPSKDIDNYISGKRNNILIGTLVVLLCAVAYVFYKSFRIANAVDNTKKAIDNLSSGNLAYKVEEKLLKRKDEIGDMGRSAEACIESLHNIVENIRNVAGNVQNEGNELETMAAHTSQNADEISNAVEDISKGAFAQAEDVESATMKVSDMGQVIEKIVSNISSLNEKSAGMEVAGTQAQRIINELSDSNDKTTEAVQLISKNVADTDQSVKKISDAVEMITSIAEQTSLLSLNASIEAARAGETGKGFAVVASEIQKLSEESNNSAQLISQIIVSLLDNSANSMNAMMEVKDRLREQQEKLDATKSQFENVSDGIISSREETVEINGQAKACDTSREKVVDIIQNLSAISEENAASTEQTTASMQELNATINLLADSAGKLKDLAVSLSESIEFFKL